MHSTDLKLVHIDIYQFKPRKDRTWWTLITSVMSNERQISPDDCAEGVSPRAEIMMYVPKPQGWMISVLKGLRHGSRALEQEFEKVNLSPVVDESRKSVV